jgi:multiple sugar transport system substrate-binding protein
MFGKRKIFFAAILCLAVFSLLFLTGGGEKKGKEITITVSVLSGVHKGPFLAAKPLFEAEHPGVIINIVEYPFSDIYDKEMLEATSHSGAIDIYEMANGWMPDFVEGGFLLPLDDYFAEKDPWLDDIYPAFKGLMEYNDKYYALLLDGDVFMAYYRKDLFQDPKEKAAFKRRYGYDLAIPKTWDEWADMAEFFHRDTDGDGEIDLYGNNMMYSRLHGPFTFMQFLHTYGGTYFNPDTMEPLPSSEANTKAYGMLARLLKYGAPDMVNWGYSEMDSAAMRGVTAMIMQWNEVSWEIRDESLVKNKIMYGPVPGAMVKGKYNAPALEAWGWCAAISVDSKNPDMAYEFLHFISSPEISLEIFAMPYDGLEPWRASHFADEAMPKWRELTPNAPAWLDALKLSVENGVPDLRIPGMFEYYDVVGIHIVEALVGKKSPEKALADIKNDWKKITERRGFDKQKRAYRTIYELEKAGMAVIID